MVMYRKKFPDNSFVGFHESMAQIRESEGDYLSASSHYHDAFKEEVLKGNMKEAERLRKLKDETYYLYSRGKRFFR